MRAHFHAALFLLALAFTSGEAIARPPASTIESSPTVRAQALVELYTSEGCSSCPPADALLAELSAHGDVVALSFHVTYWDRLGWRDPFSDSTSTARQHAYAERFKLGSLYTPQMVVGGRKQFVGSDRAAAAEAIRGALSRPENAEMLLGTRVDGSSVMATVRVENAARDAVLFVAWADAERTSSPDRGENHGARLRHVAVVRELERIALQGGRYDGVVRLTRPERVAGAVVAWVQRGDSGDVLAARREQVPAR